MPEGDAVHRAARRLQSLVGKRVEVKTPHPRASVERIAERLDGRRLLGVDAHGKNLLLRFDGGYTLRSHLRMSGRWSLVRRGSARTGRPWLVLRGAEQEAVLWNGPVLELVSRAEVTRAKRVPDILAQPPDYDTMLDRLRRTGQGRDLGDALLDQRLVAGIGNLWRAEALWEVGLSPWLRLPDVSDDELRAVLVSAHRLMSRSLGDVRSARRVYRRAGRPCPRCGERIRSRGQGDANRIAYWCPGCQRGPA